MIADDYVIIRIAEVNGEVISNNSSAHGSFAILQCGHSSDMTVGATEFSRFDPAGIACITLPSSTQTLNSLTIEVLDRSGAPANFGRFPLVGVIARVIPNYAITPTSATFGSSCLRRTANF